MARIDPRQVHSYLVQRGVSVASAAGILANIQAESGFNPGAVGDNGTSGGLFQHHAGRWDNLRRFAAASGRSWADWTAQVDFALMEARQMGLNLRSTNAAHAAREWTLRFERPANAQRRAAERAASAGRFMYDDGGGGGYVPPPGGGTPPAPMAPGIPPPGVGAVNAYYNSLYAGYNTDFALSQALTQNQVGYARRQQQFANELAGFQQQGLSIQREQEALENRFQNDLAFLNQKLTKSQRLTNQKEWRAIATNIAELQELAAQGLAQDEAYTTKAKNLQKQIHATTQRWLDKQVGFTTRDFTLAKQAIRNVVTTEAARWREVKRLTGAEKDIARQKRAFINQGAQEAYAQATAIARRRFGDTAATARFVEAEQAREARSDAIARGAMSSRGFAEDLGAFEAERGLKVRQARTERAGVFGQARVTRDDIMRMASVQLRSEIEQINQAYHQGAISFQDAQRQAHNAQLRARLTFDQNVGALAHQRERETLEHRGRYMNLQKQWDDAILGYRQNRSNLDERRALAYNQFLSNRANLNAQQQEAARRQAYNNALYGTNLAQLSVTGGSYAAQLAAQQAASRYGINQSYIGGAMNINDINTARSTTQAEQLAALNAYGTLPPAGYSVAPPQRPRSAYGYDPGETTRRSAGIYVPPASAYGN